MQSCMPQVLEDGLDGAQAGYIKVGDEVAADEPFIGPPCRRTVDAPQVSNLSLGCGGRALLHVP